MKVVSLMGGLGNQMFQYAFGAAWSPRVYYDLSWFKRVKKIKAATQRKYELDVFNLKLRKKPWLFSPRRKIVEKPENIFNPEYLAVRHGHLKGYFQTEKYFTHIRKKLIRDFSLRKPLDAANMKMLARIKEHECAVSVHIRRGDYVKLTHIHTLQSPEYYTSAMKYLKSAGWGKPHYFVFSDDLDWAVKNVDFGKDFTPVDINDTDAAAFDLELMKNCKHNIIANSSFSWWGAWLNKNPNKIVIAPKIWFGTADMSWADIIPKSWIVL